MGQRELTPALRQKLIMHILALALMIGNGALVASAMVVRVTLTLTLTLPNLDPSPNPSPNPNPNQARSSPRTSRALSSSRRSAPPSI